ncbi:MAG: CopG family transcriptional regulator [Deltaproteobacteria bacterium]|nr:CopG family transcriptional regulator [Deltaproteobacteria bacterium]
MRTIQMTLDEKLVQSVDKVVKELKMTRSAFTRNALRSAVNDFSVSRLEEKQRKGYLLHPVNKDEFAMWEEE